VHTKPVVSLALYYTWDFLTDFRKLVRYYQKNVKHRLESIYVNNFADTSAHFLISNKLDKFNMILTRNLTSRKSNENVYPPWDHGVHTMTSLTRVNDRIGRNRRKWYRMFDGNHKNYSSYKCVDSIAVLCV